MQSERPVVEDDRPWLATGKTAAWVCGLFSIGVGALFILPGVWGLTPPNPGREDLVAYYAYREAVVPWQQLRSAMVLVFTLALAPVGLALRRCVRPGPAADLMALAFAGGALMGAAFALTNIRGVGAVARTAVNAPPEMLATLEAVSTMAVNPLWMGLTWGTFLLIAVGSLLAARLGGATAGFPRGWLAVSVLLGLVLLAGLTPLDFLAILLSTGVLIPIWAIWLARILGRRGGTAPGPDRVRKSAS